MPYVTVGRENSGNVDIYYEDHGEGPPVVLIHGFPLNGASWEKQIQPLLDAGRRVVYYDRRGFGQSSKPTVGYDWDTFAADLQALMEELDLRDTVLAGFSMGTGEVVRYLANYGSDRVSRAALLATIPPLLLKTDENPEGVPGEAFEGFKDAARKDRPAFLKTFLDNFNNVDVYMGSRISEQAWQQEFAVGIQMSAIGTLRCIDTWTDDFRADLPKLDVPVLLIHGTADRILPFDATAKHMPGTVDDLHFIEIEGGPHNIGWTFPEEVNRALLDFVAGREPAAVGEAVAVSA
jgi:non-heme chloroperoxidase